jgi:hypothetical protein
MQLRSVMIWTLFAMTATAIGAQNLPATGDAEKQPVVSTDPGATVKTSLPNRPTNNLPTIYLAGDSTVRKGRGDGASGQWGWGEPLVEYFDTTKINIVNRAIGERSSRT